MRIKIALKIFIALFAISIFLFLFIRDVSALTTDLIVTTCYQEDIENTTCYDAIKADGGTDHAFTKNIHLDAPFQTLSATSVASATFYFDSSGTLSGTWGIYVKDARDGNTICSVDPAPEDLTETNNSISCNSITTTQLSNGVWMYASNDDGAGPEDITLDYVRLYVDYIAAPAVAISITTDGSAPFGTLGLNITRDTTSEDLDDVQTVSVDTGPADLEIKSTNYTGAGTLTLSSAPGANLVHFEYSDDGSSWNTFVVANNYYSLATNVAESGTQDVYFRLTTPISVGSYGAHGADITILASVP